MDVVHHALIGLAGYAGLAGQQREIAGMAFAAASVFPDLDVIFMALGKRFYLKNHQGLTHSLILSPVYALLLAGPLMALTGFDLLIPAAALVGLWLHILLDALNTFGIAPWAPFSYRRYSHNFLFFIDLPAYILTGAMLISSFVLKVPGLAPWYFSLLAVYIVFKYLLYLKVMKTLACDFAIPSAFNPFLFFVLETNKHHLTTYLYQALKKTKHDLKTIRRAQDKYYQMARQSGVYRDMEKVAKALHITEIREDEDGLDLTASDLAVRHFGGRFAQTRLRFGPRGELINELADI